MKAIKKAVNGTTTTKTTIRPVATKDSTEYFRQKSLDKVKDIVFTTRTDAKKAHENDMQQSLNDMKRQRLKGKPGYDKNGYPIKKNGGSIKAKDGKWMQKAAASIKRRGTAGKCTPITKPGCTGKAKALAKTFKKIAKSNKKK